MGCLGCRHPRKFVNHTHNNFDNRPRTQLTQTIGRAIAALLFAALSATVACTSSSLNSTGPSAAKCQVTVSSADAPIAAAGGTTTVAISAQPECAWTANTDVAWITDLAPPAGQGNSAVQVHAAPNADPVTRRGMVHIASTDVQITQAASPCVFQVSPLTRDVGATGGAAGVSVSANGACGWTAASTVSWIRITSATTATGNGAVTIAVDANTGPARDGVVTVAGQTVTVSQASVQTPSPAPAPGPQPPPSPSPGPSPPTCDYSLTPSSASSAAAGGTGTIAVTAPASCSWTATSPDGWITILSGKGSGNGSVTYNVAPNTGAARSGSITIAGHTVRVNQAELCTYSISPTSQSVGSGGGSGNVSVTTTNACGWTAASNDAWITVTSGAAGTGNGTVAFTAALNTGAARSGTMTIAGQTFTVSQGSGCTYHVIPTSETFPWSGGTDVVQVTARAPSCPWTAVSGDDWITVIGPASGLGNGTVTFVAAPSDGNARTGGILIATEKFTVTETQR
jgi:all-beta uncharacterized protein